MSFYPRRPPPSPPRGKSEFEILKSAHKFLRPDEENDASKSWDDQLARKYYDGLYKEYALCDLKHYKSGNFALRWRTENEVLSGAGEETCGNTRCSHHDSPDNGVKLTPVELPFVYAEEGQTKSALVKVVLCRRCLDKLMYKHRKEKERALPPASESARQVKLEDDDDVRNECVWEKGKVLARSVLEYSLHPRLRHRATARAIAGALHPLGSLTPRRTARIPKLDDTGIHGRGLQSPIGKSVPLLVGAARPSYVVPANNIRGGAHATGYSPRQPGQNANKNHRAEHRP
ncbi:folate-sensitive fragile site protein Fra10Ac1-domain-containing protein [Schizophyllum commune]